MLREELVNNYYHESLGTDIEKILELARSSHEKYLLKSGKNDIDMAIAYYFQAIKIDPNFAEPYYKLSSLLWEKGEIDLKSAVKQCEKAIKLAPNSSGPRLYLGYFLKASGRYEEAEKVFQEAISLASFKSSRARIAFATTVIERLKEVEFSLKDFIKAVYFFSTGVAMSVYDCETLRFLGKSAKEKIRVSAYKCKASVFKSFRNYDATIKTYEKAAEKTGNKSLFYSEAGDLFIELKNPQQAANYYRKILKDSPDDVVTWAKLAELLQNCEKDNLEEIINCFKNIARLEPSNSRVFYELGHLLLRTDDKFSSVNSFKRAIDVEPQNAFYHNSLAYALVQLQDYDGAVNEYQQAIRLNPDNEWTSIVSQALGAIYHQVKDNLDAAIVSYQTATILDKNNIDAFIALGEAYQDKGELDNAIECYCSAIKLNPEVPRIYCNLGLLLWEKGHADEALVAYQRAINLNPDYEIAFNNMGVVYLDGLENPAEAIVMFDNAIKQNPNYALAYYNKGRAYQEMNNNHEAASFYQMALDINKLTQELDEEEVESRLYSLFSVL